MKAINLIEIYAYGMSKDLVSGKEMASFDDVTKKS